MLTIFRELGAMPTSLAVGMLCMSSGGGGWLGQNDALGVVPQ